MAIKGTLQAWVIIAKNNIQTQLLTPSSSILFVVGKLFNFVFSVIVIFAIFTATKFVKGYSLNQAVIVVLVYSLLESVIQFFFRSIYNFRPVIVKGDFDLDLLKPLPSFFRPLLSGPDFLDFPLIIIQAAALIYFLIKLNFSINLFRLLDFGLWTFVSIVISFFTLLFIAAFCILTSEIDNLTWMYRSFMRAGSVPTDIYSGAFLFLLNFIIPITIIITVPAKALLGILDLPITVYTLLFTFFFSLLSWSFWRYSLRRYTSASS